MHQPVLPVAVIVGRRALASRWQSHVWEAIGVIPERGGSPAPRLLMKDSAEEQWLHGGLELKLYRDEAESYYLNLSSRQPCVFVVLRMEELLAVPKFITVSYGEAARFMDANEQVDSVPMPRDVSDWLQAFVEAHYRPKPEKRSRPPSFDGARRG